MRGIMEMKKNETKEEKRIRDCIHDCGITTGRWRLGFVGHNL